MNKRILQIIILLYAFVSPVLAAESQDLIVDLTVQPEPTVGTPAELSFTFSYPGTGEPARDIWVKMDILIVEDALSLFTGNFYVPDGRLDLTYHFQDATEHSIYLVISPDLDSEQRFQEVSKIFFVDVAAPAPPTTVWFKTLLFLMGLMILGIAIGYYGVVLRSKNAA